MQQIALKMQIKANSLLSVTPRGLSRELAAGYIGVSVSKFDQMVADGRMPKPIQIDGRRVWDIRWLDIAFDSIVESMNYIEDNPWDKVA